VCWWKGTEDMLIEYRLEKVNPEKTAEIEKKKEAQKDKQDKAWNDEEASRTGEKAGEPLDTKDRQMS
jgi:hypothetical protein